MTRMARITVLVDNHVEQRGLLAEPGLAYWIEVAGRRLLFDTGEGGVLSSNARRLSIWLEMTDAVVLSHGHYDHTGGLHHVLQVAPEADIYAHPDVVQPKYARNEDGTSRDVGMPGSARQALKDGSHRLIDTNEPTEICPGLSATGEVPRSATFEEVGGPFFTDPACEIPDPLLDDQALYFETDHGIVVLLGCAHAGVINTLSHIQKLSGGRPIHAVIGGMHLVNAKQDRLDRTISGLRQFDVERIGPAHCTGLSATVALWSALPGRCFPCMAGTRMEFELASVTALP